jgi:hypothetical protein
MALLDPPAILRRADGVIKELRAYSSWRSSLDGGTLEPDTLFVSTLTGPWPSSRELFDYFIVSVRRGGGISARLVHHAETGEFLEAEAVRTVEGFLPSFANPITALGTRLTHSDHATHAVMWRPCDQSSSRFLPFWIFEIERKPVYVRADGVLFDQLTFSFRG